MRTDVLDFPTAWEIQDTVPMEHGSGCSSDPRSGPLAGPAFLCDCGAVTHYWERFVAAAGSETPHQPQNGEQG